MSKSSLTHRLNSVQKLLDRGIPVTIQGMEYIQLDKLYVRAVMTRGDGSKEARPIEVSSSRLALIDLVSKMSEDEYASVVGTLTLNDFNNRAFVTDMVHEAMQIYKEFSGKKISISSYIDKYDNTVNLDKPIIIYLKPEAQSLPFQICCPELFAFGKNIEGFDTIYYNFAKLKSENVNIPDGSYIYGSRHETDGKAHKPVFKILETPEFSMSP